MQIVTNNRNLWTWLRNWWNPKPIEPPTINADIKDMEGLQRSAEVIRYSVLSFEFWISPNGQVREWLRNNSLLAACLAVPAFLLMPIITFALVKLDGWLSLLVGILMNLILLPFLALAAWGVIVIVKSLFGKK